jgi:hypothetical protein
MYKYACFHICTVRTKINTVLLDGNLVTVSRSVHIHLLAFDTTIPLLDWRYTTEAIKMCVYNVMLSTIKEGDQKRCTGTGFCLFVTVLFVIANNKLSIPRRVTECIPVNEVLCSSYKYRTLWPKLELFLRYTGYKKENIMLSLVYEIREPEKMTDNSAKWGRINQKLRDWQW